MQVMKKSSVTAKRNKFQVIFKLKIYRYSKGNRSQNADTVRSLNGFCSFKFSELSFVQNWAYYQDDDLLGSLTSSMW